MAGTNDLNYQLFGVGCGKSDTVLICR